MSYQKKTHIGITLKPLKQELKKKEKKTMIGKTFIPTCFQSTNTFENCIKTSKRELKKTSKIPRLMSPFPTSIEHKHVWELH
jgi:methyl coenzyme M reductase subunit C-like uncharacterized protein (methanogenesis marker protein 7)